MSKLQNIFPAGSQESLTHYQDINAGRFLSFQLMLHFPYKLALNEIIQTA